MTGDALDTWRWMVRRWPGARPVVWGHSLGSGVASGLARALQRSNSNSNSNTNSNTNSIPAQTDILPAAVVLEAPFNSVPGVVFSHIRPIVTPWLEAIIWSHLSTVRFDSESRIAAVSCGIENGAEQVFNGIPTLILAARHDSVVPFKLARRLYDRARENCANGSHSRAKLLTYHLLANAEHDSIMDQQETIGLVSDFFGKVAALPVHVQ